MQNQCFGVGVRFQKLTKGQRQRDAAVFARRSHAVLREQVFLLPVTGFHVLQGGVGQQINAALEQMDSRTF